MRKFYKAAFYIFHFTFLLSLISIYSEGLAGEPSDLSKALCHPVRKEILDTLRRQVKEWSDQEVVFKVQYIKANEGWAYAHVLPRTKDGKNNFEDVSALLAQEKGAWAIKETRPCCGECADDPDCADDRRYFNRLKARFPNAPKDIFPSVE